MKNVLSFSSALVAVIATFASPAAAEVQKPVDFVVKTCLDSIADLSKVDVIAKEQNWKVKGEKEARHSDLKINSTWEVDQEGQHFVVLTGTGRVGGLGSSNICMVMFNDPQVIAQEFIERISGSIRMKSFAEMKLPVGRMDMHEIEKADGKKAILQVMSKTDGAMIFASVIGEQ